MQMAHLLEISFGPGAVTFVQMTSVYQAPCCLNVVILARRRQGGVCPVFLIAFKFKIRELSVITDRQKM